MDGEVEFAELFTALLNGGFKAAFFADIELQEELGAQRFGQRLRVFGGLGV